MVTISSFVRHTYIFVFISSRIRNQITVHAHPHLAYADIYVVFLQSIFEHVCVVAFSLSSFIDNENKQIEVERCLVLVHDV